MENALLQGWDSWDLKKIAPGAQAEEMRAARRNGGLRFFFNDVQGLGRGIREMIGPEQNTFSQKPRASSGHVAVFRPTAVRLRVPARWFRILLRTSCLAPAILDPDAIASPVYGDLKFILSLPDFCLSILWFALTPSAATIEFH